MRKWIILAAIAMFGTLAFAACGGGSDTNTESVDDGSLPQVSDDDRPSVGGAYRVTVNFNEGAVQADIEQIGELLAEYDEDAEYIVLESFPSTGVATLITDDENFCQTAVALLEAEAFVTSVSCGPLLEPGDVHSDGQDPGELTDADCEPVQLRSDCGIDTDVCNEIHNIGACEVEEDPPLAPPDARPSAEGQYRVTISFNETVNEDQLDEVGARIRDFDPDAEYVIQESFPPTGVANFVAETEDVCLALVQGFEVETFVTSVTCGPLLEPGDTDPNEPVVNDLE